MPHRSVHDSATISKSNNSNTTNVVSINKAQEEEEDVKKNKASIFPMNKLLSRCGPRFQQLGGASPSSILPWVIISSFWWIMLTSNPLGDLVDSMVSAANTKVEADRRFLKMSSSVGRELRKTKAADEVVVEGWYLNDKTIQMTLNLQRNWYDYYSGKTSSKPKRKLILTDIGWNHPDQEYALRTFTRGIRSREILQAFIDHPDFDPTYRWSEMMMQSNNTTSSYVDSSIEEYIVLMDIETCFESHYPHYTGTYAFNENNISNSDSAGGRLVDNKQNRECYRVYPGCTHKVNDILESPLFQNAPTDSATLLYLECSGEGPAPQFRKDVQPSSQLTLLSLGSRTEKLNLNYDMGFPYGALYPTTLTTQEEQAIQSCQSDTELTGADSERSHLFLWIGDGRKQTDVPKGFFYQENLAKPNENVIIHHDDQYSPYAPNSKLPIYKREVRKSLFVGTPRQSNLVPYLLTEALSAGAIPVIASDGWVKPFRQPEVIDWTKCAVLIPDNQAMQTLEILRKISPQKRCEMRQYCYFHIYQKYMINATANLRGVLEGLHVMHPQRSTSSSSQ